MSTYWASMTRGLGALPSGVSVSALSFVRDVTEAIQESNLSPPFSPGVRERVAVNRREPFIGFRERGWMLI